MKNKTNKIIIMGFFITLLTACNEEATEKKETIRPVKVLEMVADGGGKSRIFSGSSRFIQESKLSFKIAGTVIAIPVKVGDELKAGDLIAELSSSSQTLEVQQSQAALLQTEANERNAKASYERIKGLYTNNNASKNDLDSARANAESAAAQSKASRKALELARLNLSYTQLTTPMDCRVASVEVEVNENVSAGSAIAMTSCGSSMEVRLNIPESLIVGVQQDMPVNIRFGSIKDKVYQGRVTEVASSTGANASTFPVVVSIQGTHAELRSGLGAEVEFVFNDEHSSGHLFVPLNALVKDQRGNFVFIAAIGINKEGSEKGQASIQRRDVSIGELDSEGVEILSGLNPGDKVVVAGVSQIHVGQTVLVD